MQKRSLGVVVTVALSMGAILTTAWIANRRNLAPESNLSLASSGRDPFVSQAVQHLGMHGVAQADEIGSVERGPVQGSQRCVSFHVFSEYGGVPIARAEITLGQCTRRFTRQDSIRPEAMTEPSGSVRVCDLRDGQLAFTITADGFVPCVVTVLDGEENATAYLSKGNSMVVLAEDLDGVGVPRCRVFVSMAIPPSQSEMLAVAELGVSPGVGKGAVYQAQTDEAGIAVFGGLPEGQYYVSAIKSGHAVTECTPAGGVRVPGEAFGTIRLAPVYALVLSASDDEVVGYGITGPTKGVLSTLPMRDLIRESASLSKRFPGSAVAAFASEGITEATLVRARLFLKRRGLTEGSFPLTRVDLIDRPTELGIKHASSSEGCGSLSVRLRDAAGQSLPEGLFFVSVNGLNFPLRDGEACLPRGTHQLQCSDSRLNGAYSPSEVSVPGTAMINVGLPLQAVLLRVVEEGGAEYGRYRVTIWCFEKVTTHLIMNSADKLFHLPPGPATFSVTVLGFVPVVLDETVVQQEGAQEITVVLGG